MKCSNCGSSKKGFDLYCPHCGTKKWFWLITNGILCLIFITGGFSIFSEGKNNLVRAFGIIIVFLFFNGFGGSAGLRGIIKFIFSPKKNLIAKEIITKPEEDETIITDYYLKKGKQIKEANKLILTNRRIIIIYNDISISYPLNEVLDIKIDDKKTVWRFLPIIVVILGWLLGGMILLLTGELKGLLIIVVITMLGIFSYRSSRGEYLHLIINHLGNTKSYFAEVNLSKLNELLDTIQSYTSFTEERISQKHRNSIKRVLINHNARSHPFESTKKVQVHSSRRAILKVLLVYVGSFLLMGYGVGAISFVPIGIAAVLLFMRGAKIYQDKRWKELMIFLPVLLFLLSSLSVTYQNSMKPKELVKKEREEFRKKELLEETDKRIAEKQKKIVRTPDAEKVQELLSEKRYSDPKGFFKIVPPANWQIHEYPQDPRGKVAFYGPEEADFRVLAKVDTGLNTFEDLWEALKEIESNIGIPTNMKKIDFLGWPAIQRTFSAKGHNMFSIDFIERNVWHNLFYGTLPSKYDKYLPVVVKSMNTYETMLRNVSESEMQKHIVAQKLRRAQLFIELGELKLALECVNEGLQFEPNNSDLLSLKNKINNMMK